MLTRFRQLALLALVSTATLSAEPLPGRLEGTWRITRMLPTTNSACWGEQQVAPLLGSTLTYRDNSLRWRGGSVPLESITTRTVTDEVFRRETIVTPWPPSL